MRFIKGGPEVPDRLVEFHEDGKVVFFCGAGISYPAGLPGFEGLTRRLFEDLGEDLNSTETAAFEEKNGLMWLLICWKEESGIVRWSVNRFRPSSLH